MTNKLKRFAKLFGAFNLALLIALAAAPAGAATLTFSDTISLTPTDWDLSFSVNQFDPALGTLTMVELILNGNVQGDILEESQDTSPRLITANLSAMITASPSFGALSVSVNPAVNRLFNASAFDGVIDFGGTSGTSFLGLAGNDSDSIASNVAADLLGFTGLGQVVISANAVGDSSATGSGNLITQFITAAGADLTVRYTYEPKGPPNEIPEPATYAMLGAGLAGLAFLRRRVAK